MAFQRVRLVAMTPAATALWVVAQNVVDTGRDQGGPLWWAFVALAVMGVIAGFVLYGRRGRSG